MQPCAKTAEAGGGRCFPVLPRNVFASMLEILLPCHHRPAPPFGMRFYNHQYLGHLTSSWLLLPGL